MSKALFAALLAVLFASAATIGAEARLLKVLPYLLDADGRHALQPSLYERDAYQAKLRSEPGLAHGLRYDLQWKLPRNQATGATVRLELRSGSGREGQILVLETPVRPGWFGRGWTRLELSEAQFREFGRVTAWRVTLRRGGSELAEEKSFLW